MTTFDGAGTEAKIVRDRYGAAKTFIGELAQTRNSSHPRSGQVSTSADQPRGKEKLQGSRGSGSSAMHAVGESRPRRTFTLPPFASTLRTHSSSASEGVSKPLSPVRSGRVSVPSSQPIVGSSSLRVPAASTSVTRLAPSQSHASARSTVSTAKRLNVSSAPMRVISMPSLLPGPADDAAAFEQDTLASRKRHADSDDDDVTFLPNGLMQPERATSTPIGTQIQKETASETLERRSRRPQKRIQDDLTPEQLDAIREGEKEAALEDGWRPKRKGKTQPKKPVAKEIVIAMGEDDAQTYDQWSSEDDKTSESEDETGETQRPTTARWESMRRLFPHALTRTWQQMAENAVPIPPIPFADLHGYEVMLPHVPFETSPRPSPEPDAMVDSSELREQATPAPSGPPTLEPGIITPPPSDAGFDREAFFDAISTLSRMSLSERESGPSTLSMSSIRWHKNRLNELMHLDWGLLRHPNQGNSHSQFRFKTPPRPVTTIEYPSPPRDADDAPPFHEDRPTPPFGRKASPRGPLTRSSAAIKQGTNRKREQAAGESASSAADVIELSDTDEEEDDVAGPSRLLAPISATQLAELVERRERVRRAPEEQNDQTRQLEERDRENVRVRREEEQQRRQPEALARSLGAIRLNGPGNELSSAIEVDDSDDEDQSMSPE